MPHQAVEPYGQSNTTTTRHRARHASDAFPSVASLDDDRSRCHCHDDAGLSDQRRAAASQTERYVFPYRRADDAAAPAAVCHAGCSAEYVHSRDRRLRCRCAPTRIWAVLLVTACLGFVAFFAGYDSPWFGDRAAARRAFAANLPMYEAMARHRARLRPAIERGDLPSLQAALDAGDPTLTPAQLVCLVRTEVIEGRTGTPPPVSERRYRFLDAVANAAWRSEDNVNGRQTIGLLAVDAALRHGPAADLRRWLERGVQVQGIHWGRDVSELTEPAGQCSTVVYWPLNLLQYNQHNPSDKLALLIEHGVQPDSLMPGRSLFEIAPLSAETVAALAKLGFRPYPGGPERNVGAPLALAIRMAERRCEGDCANVFAFGDDEIVRYMEVLRDAGAEPDQRAWDGRDAWATLFDVRQRLTARQQSDIHTARDCGIVLEPGSAQPDSTRTDLLRRIEQVLRDPPRNSQSSTNPATTSSG
ncbi:hypothetical protein BRI6_4763 [plant metagenome]|uniref:Uncharacterized protein n=1 Tax=plant metagenome TaxID=1297885 RepID=A0A484SGI5_9ZZZZ